MWRSVDVINSEVDGLLSPVIRSVRTTTALAQSQPNSLRTLGGLNSFYEQIERAPQAFSQYIGLPALAVQFESERIMGLGSTGMIASAAGG